MDRWSKDAMKQWVSVLEADDLFRSGVKQMVAAGDFTPPRNAHEWAYIFKNEADIQSCLNLDLKWFADKIVESKKKAMNFPIAIARKGRLSDSPKVIVGTIHSVKGGEADHVYVFPDISYKAHCGQEQDTLIRMFYVAMTRAKQTLTLCERGSRHAVSWL